MTRRGNAGSVPYEAARSHRRWSHPIRPWLDRQRQQAPTLRNGLPAHWSAPPQARPSLISLLMQPLLRLDRARAISGSGQPSRLGWMAPRLSQPGRIAQSALQPPATVTREPSADPVAARASRGTVPARPAVLLGSLLAPTLLLATLGGCAHPGPDGRAPTEIQVWTLDLAPRFSPFLTDVIRRWEARHPGIRVRWTDVPWSSVERKLLAAVFARTAPDLVNLNPPFAANLASKGGLRDLTPLLPEAAAQRYLPGIWAAGRQGSLQFAVPWYLTTRVTMANRSLLSQAGYAAPPSRWEQVPAYAEAVKRRTGRYALFVTVVPDDSAELLESMVQMGVRLLDDRQRAAFDSAAGRRAFAFWTDLYRRGLLPREVVSQGYRRAIELYQAGDLAQVASGPDFLRNLQTNAPGIAARTRAWPPLRGSGDAVNVAVMNLVVPRQSPRARQALDFALFLTDAANQLQFSREARVLPSSRQALSALERQLREQPEPGANGALVLEARQLSAASLRRAQVLVPATPGVKRLQAILYTQLQRAMLGEIGSDAAVAEARLQWDRYAEARWP